MPSSVTPGSEQFFSIRIDRETRDQLEQLAKRNERTLSAEIRVALRRHLRLEPQNEEAK